MRSISFVTNESEGQSRPPRVSAEKRAALLENLQSGEMGAEAFELITHRVPAFTTIATAEVDSLQRDLIAATFGIESDGMERFRWGIYATPDGSPLSEHKFMTVWQQGSEGVEQLVMTVAPSGALAIKTEGE